MKNNGIYDIPKGRIDPGETPLQCAIRESKEEAGIDITHLDSGPFCFDRITVWLTESYQKPCVGINPITCEKEHLGYAWLPGEVLEAQCLDYLRIKYSLCNLHNTHHNVPNVTVCTTSS